LRQGVPDSILRPLCDALEYAHRFTVHRDISPENMMVLEDGSVKLLDFGIAKAKDAAAIAGVTRDGLGKAYYIAPEQRKDAAHVDARADIFSLGVTFFELLTGAYQMPFGVSHVTGFRRSRKCDAQVGLSPASGEGRKAGQNLRSARRSEVTGREQTAAPKSGQRRSERNGAQR
jgi:serine/threonine protein kinase